MSVTVDEFRVKRPEYETVACRGLVSQERFAEILGLIKPLFPPEPA